MTQRTEELVPWLTLGQGAVRVLLQEQGSVLVRGSTHLGTELHCGNLCIHRDVSDLVGGDNNAVMASFNPQHSFSSTDSTWNSVPLLVIRFPLEDPDKPAPSQAYSLCCRHQVQIQLTCVEEGSSPFCLHFRKYRHWWWQTQGSPIQILKEIFSWIITI